MSGPYYTNPNYTNVYNPQLSSSESPNITANFHQKNNTTKLHPNYNSNPSPPNYNSNPSPPNYNSNPAPPNYNSNRVPHNTNSRSPKHLKRKRSPSPHSRNIQPIPRNNRARMQDRQQITNVIRRMDAIFNNILHQDEEISELIEKGIGINKFMFFKIMHDTHFHGRNPNRSIFVNPQNRQWACRNH
jgi:hypothetical protein